MFEYNSTEIVLLNIGFLIMVMAMIYCVIKEKSYYETTDDKKTV